MYQSPENRKNFRVDLDAKNSQEKVHKENRKNFYKLEETIMN